MRRVLFLTLILAPAPASAACTSLTASGLSFGTYTGLAVTNSAATVKLNGCTNNFTISVGLNAGIGPGATTTTRKMTSGQSTLNYQMFQDVASTTNWGNIKGVDARTGSTGDTSSLTLNIHGSLLALQYPAPGSYTDTITATGQNSGNITTSFIVNTTVSPTCTLSATTLNFGTYSGVATNGTSTITVTCTNTTPYNIGLDPGLATGATVTTRAMTLGTKSLGYALTSDAAHAINWGQTVGTDTVAGTGTGVARMLTVYGRIAIGQYLNPGTYNDTIIATVTY